MKKVFYKDLAKNATQLNNLFALANLSISKNEGTSFMPQLLLEGVGGELSGHAAYKGLKHGVWKQRPTKTSE